jgi:hypothetical protein
MYFFGYKFGGGGLQFDGVLLNNRLGYRRDVVVKEKVVCTCGLSEWIHCRVVEIGVIGPRVVGLMSGQRYIPAERQQEWRSARG